MGELWLRCDDYDPGAKACLVETWAELPVTNSGVLPPLSVEQGVALAGAVLVLWSSAAAIRWVIRSFRSYN